MMHIANHARDIILVIALDGTIRDANPAAERAYGIDRQSLLGKNILELRAPKTTGLVPAQMLEAAQSGILFETVHQRQSGETFPCEVSSQSAEMNGETVLVSVVRDLSERHEVERALRAAEERFRALLDASPDGVVVHRDDRIIFVNQAILSLLGYDRPEELLGRSPIEMVAREFRTDVRQRIERLSSGEVPSVSQREHRLYKRGERELVTVEVWARTLEFEGAPAAMATLHDVTERRKLEEQLRHAQKMEAVGRLAGGVAHDFNNLLTAIQGQGELLAGELEPGTSAHRHAQQILRAAGRGAALTGQLLAFSRKQVLQPRVLDLNQVVNGLHTLLRRVIGEDIELVTELASEPCAIFADAGQLEQVIVNLAVNARDAMPSGGELMLRTAFDELDSKRCVLLEVRDTGCGMSAETKARLFEPFFTTKPRGKGTGLGLATVYGIVAQSGGQITVESEPSRGAIFRVRLALAAAAPETQQAPRPMPAERGTETVLVVEDDGDVRRFLREVLEVQGYRVLEAHDGVHALEVATAGGPVELVVTDVIMPRMSGVDMVERLRALLRPAPKVLFITGYPGETAMANREPLLSKPFSVAELARRVRALLDS